MRDREHEKRLAYLNLGGQIAKSVIFAIEVKIVISHGLRSSGSQTVVNECSFFSLNSMEMTGGVVLERQGSIHHVQKQEKINDKSDTSPKRASPYDVSAPEQGRELTIESTDTIRRF